MHKNSRTFIEQIAPFIQKHALNYGIRVVSPIIAQAVLESASGTSELAIYAHNYFGLKYRTGRCPTASGTYYKIGSEQNANGSYIASTMEWQKFDCMENGVIGYFDFINISNYSNLKGISDPLLYLEAIKKDGYATSILYVTNLMNVISKYNLTKYDQFEKKESENKLMVFNVHAGHNPDGKIACGAIGLIRESTEARLVKDKVIELLRGQKHTVYDCTVSDGKNQNDVLSKIVSKCNQHKVDYDISIHFNSGAKNIFGNKKTTGTEVLIYSNNSKSKQIAQNIVDSISTLGLKNRGIKFSKNLYFLRKTNSPALLIECIFVDDLDDVKIYSVDKMANAIVKGITGVKPPINGDPNSDKNTNSSVKFLHNGIDYSLVFNPTYYANEYADLKAAFGTNGSSLFDHFISNGMKEGRQGISSFHVAAYRNRYADLRSLFGTDLTAYYVHYITNGYSEKRKAT